MGFQLSEKRSGIAWFRCVGIDADGTVSSLGRTIVRPKEPRTVKVIDRAGVVVYQVETQRGLEFKVDVSSVPLDILVEWGH